MDSEEAIYGELYYHSNRFCLVGKFQFGSLVRRLKEAVMRFSVHSCWSPILESSRTPPRVFSSGFSRKFRTTSTEQQGTATLEPKKRRWKYWSSIVLFDSGITCEKFQVSGDFCWRFLSSIIFRGLYLKSTFDREKAIIKT